MHLDYILKKPYEKLLYLCLAYKSLDPTSISNIWPKKLLHIKLIVKYSRFTYITRVILTGLYR